MKLALQLPTLLVLASYARGEAALDEVRVAIDKGLRRIEAGAASYTTHRQCFSCHHQALPILTMTSAQKRGFEIEPAKLRQQLEFTLDTFSRSRLRFAKGSGCRAGIRRPSMP